MSALRSHLSGKRYRACFDAMSARKMDLTLFRPYGRNSAKHFLTVCKTRGYASVFLRVIHFRFFSHSEHKQGCRVCVV